MKTKILDYLNELFPNARCELDYNKDYELLIAVMLSAQTTDKRVNQVTPILFGKYKTLEELANADIADVEAIIRPLGTYHAKASNAIKIAQSLVKKPICNDREYLESLSGVGRKTTNVVLAELYNEPYLAVDTHVNRVAKRLGIAKESDDVGEVEKKLMNFFPRENIIHINHQLVFFGRYHCTAVKPNCKDCKLKDICTNEKKDI